MKKLMTFMIAAVIMAAAVSQAAEKKCSSVGDAEDRWNFNMKSEALACLDEIITADPANAKAHFLKGKYCFATGNYGCARERFAAGPVRAKYASEIAGFYKNAGDARLNAGDVKQAEEFYLEAGNYNPAISKETAVSLFANGKAKKDDNLLYLAGRLNPGLKQAIGDYYYGESKNAPNAEAKVKNLARAAEYDNTKTAEYHENRDNLGRFHLDEAKKWARKPGMEKTANEHKAQACKYLGDAKVNAELPMAKIYQPGTYTLSLKAGEQTEYWITFPSGRITNYSLSSKDYNYQIVFEDGKVMKDGENVTYPKNEYTFRIIAISDQPVINMVVK